MAPSFIWVQLDKYGDGEEGNKKNRENVIDYKDGGRLHLEVDVGIRLFSIPTGYYRNDQIHNQWRQNSWLKKMIPVLSNPGLLTVNILIKD